MTKHERMFKHEHAHKLDDPERRNWLPPDEVIQKLAPLAGQHVADIGAGTGYFALPLARAIAPAGGHLVAVDMQAEMLTKLRERLDGDLPIELVHGEATHTTLPDASQDLVFVANVWHELDDPSAALAEINRITRPNARLAILDWRPDVEQPPGPPLDHRIATKEVIAALEAHGWQNATAENVGRYSYLVVASKVRS